MGARSRSPRASSITAGNGAIYAVQRDAYVEVDPKFGHDFGFPYLMVQAGRRAVYEPEALAFEKPAAEPEDEYGRKVRMFARARAHPHGSGSFRRDAAALPRAARLAPRAPLRERAPPPRPARLERRCSSARAPFYRLVLVLQLAGLGLAAAGKAACPIPGARLAYYYYVVTWATVAALVRYLRSGAPQTWDKAKGTR